MIPLKTALAGQFSPYGAPTYPGIVATGGWTSTDLLNNVASIVALSPDHVIGLIGVNDNFNHGGTPIPPATTQSNITSIMNTVLASFPNCKFHWVSPMWDGGEQWPLGTNSADSLVTASAGGIQAAVSAAGASVAEYIDIRDDIWTNYSPLYNPTNLTHGVLTQADGTHPSKPLGMNTLSQRAFQKLSFGT